MSVGGAGRVGGGWPLSSCRDTQFRIPRNAPNPGQGTELLGLIHAAFAPRSARDILGFYCLLKCS